ncbi:response regulator transcription factor [Hydrogenibacillus schlegelii]|uniref:DNA-binding response regulator, LuxR family n=1 Tax=Hydrogenibacillus schlegelii TaxID=1484 RepID=A0A132ND05_HYDSH|nr:response regulator transcription factor [Hydrogenibacillus schlegelii]KWX07994.1 LuxR family transcriptional regulator [Hydrogenibacillus schlegelii]MBT9283449.1 response regulator transcription factor [Hydrogenibacillus schlegelii]OAR03820.1 LuxR family transcriptional regulator [Hydrogenibacillus schlegelii]PTQ53594.1 MAG: DNA-binding response regulator, LuxR family [Hydrogenibacillus schlegelii]
MIRVVIVDDHAVVRQGLRLILERTGDIAVVGEAASGEEALREVFRKPVDAVLLDVHMPKGLDGITVARRLAEDFPCVRVVMLTMFDDTAHLQAMLAADVAGVVFKHDEPEEIVRALREGAKGRPYLPERVRLRYGGMIRDVGNQAAGRQKPLSTRETEVLVLMAQGHSNKEIAQALHLSVKTVETHRANILRKLELKTRAELVDYALKNGLIVTPPAEGSMSGG